MIIYIPTRGRIEYQDTWDNLPIELQKITHLVCPSDELQDHLSRGRQCKARPDVSLASVRQWLVDTCPEKTLIMLDDDLDFFVRRNPDAYNLKQAAPEEKIVLFERLHSYVDSGKYVHAGLSPRQMNNQHFPATEKEVTRINAVHCLNAEYIRTLPFKYDDVDFMEDYHMTLSLLEMGLPNVQITDAAWDQTRGSNATGGFSLSRTTARQKASAEKLAAAHPDFVKVVEKTPKTGWGSEMKTRTDVRIQWKKAYGSSL